MIPARARSGTTTSQAHRAWIEEQYEAFLQPLLTANGYDDVFVRIQLKRPSTDRTGSMLEQLKVGIEGKALLPDDIRRNLPDLDLGEYTPELEAALKAAYAAPAGIFGNLEGFTGKEAKGATQAGAQDPRRERGQPPGDRAHPVERCVMRFKANP